MKKAQVRRGTETMNRNDMHIKDSGGSSMPPDFPVDIVLPWVKGDDPAHKARLKAYITSEREDDRPDVGGEGRFSDMGEIRHCVASINRYAPFIRTIHIVTDGQNPDLEEYMRDLFPQGHIPMNIISHQDIFKGYEEFLPTFNSRAIETMIWRIPGLSEHFILMNDDFFITSPLTPQDFFLGEDTICYASWYSTLAAKTLWALKPKRKGRRRISFKHSMVNALDLLGGGRMFLYLGHTPRALKRSFFEDFFSRREDLIVRNIRHRFRHEEQFNSQELFYISEARQGRCVVIPPKDKAIFIMPSKGRKHIERKIKAFGNGEGYKFGCINTLSEASVADRERVLEWLKDFETRNSPPSR